MSPDDIALFRYHLIAEALNPHLSPAERGWLVRDLASRSHPHPDGGLRAYSRNTLDRWIRAYRERGLDGLRPVKRADSGSVRRHPELIGEAAALRAELPGRSAAQIADILFVRHRVVVSPRTIRSHLRRRGLQRAALVGDRRAFGRYEAERPNERWIGDVLSGPFVPHPRVAGSKKAKLFLLVDDHSRLLIHGCWMTEENTRAGQDVLRAAISRRGLPESLYLDNGAPFSNHMLERTCAVLGVRLIHSKPYSPEGRGKQERLNRYIRERFLTEVEHHGIGHLRRPQRPVHGLGRTDRQRPDAMPRPDQRPLDRFAAGGPLRMPDPALLAEAFRWSVTRAVTKTATISLQGNRYQVDPSLDRLPGRAPLRPRRPHQLDVYLEGDQVGVATPLVIGRHVHPAVPQAQPPAVVPTGVDYLGLVLAAQEEALGGPISYRDVPLFTDDQAEAGS